jgi:hypothetical protein
MQLHTEMQIRLLKTIPYERRLLHIDATSKLVKIRKYMRDYPAIFNYAMIVKDVSRLKDKKHTGILVNEMVTSRHSTQQIEEMLHSFQTDYYSMTAITKGIFKIVVSDMSWATVHAILFILNKMNVYEYSHLVFDLGWYLLLLSFTNPTTKTIFFFKQMVKTLIIIKEHG